MKKRFAKVFALTVAASLMATSAMAITYHYIDTIEEFPGYAHPLGDEYGTPKISAMDVTVDDLTGALETVEVFLEGRRDFDSLFINTDFGDGDVDWHGWDYFVRSDVQGSGNDSNIASGLYSVADSYTYTLVGSVGRTGHPEGIAAGDLTSVDSAFAPTASTGSLLYDFTSLASSIIVGNTFSIAYAPWCANDVIGASSVPEPATMLLFGAGLAGLAGARRRKKA